MNFSTKVVFCELLKRKEIKILPTYRLYLLPLHLFVRQCHWVILADTFQPFNNIKFSKQSNREREKKGLPRQIVYFLYSCWGLLLAFTLVAWGVVKVAHFNSMLKREKYGDARAARLTRFPFSIKVRYTVYSAIRKRVCKRLYKQTIHQTPANIIFFCFCGPFFWSLFDLGCLWAFRPQWHYSYVIEIIQSRLFALMHLCFLSRFLFSH